MTNRLAALLPAALLLAACTVETEGAACRVTGRTDDCPSGQACGTDLTCSLRAASCQPCTAGARTCSGDDRVVECTAAGDGACGVQVLVDPCDVLERCDASAAVAACACERIEVVPRAGAPTELPDCTFLSVAEAFSEAGALGLDGVHLAGAAPASYVDDPAGVTVPAGARLLADDDPPRPADRVLVTAGVALAEGSSARGLAVAPSGAGGGTGVTVDCSPGVEAASLAAVAVIRGAGGERFDTGVHVLGACPVVLDGIRVTGATGAGLLVARSVRDATVTATGPVLDGNGTGALLRRGAVTLQDPAVAQSAGDGIVIDGAEADAVAAVVDGSGGAGSLRGGGAAGSAGVRVRALGPAATVELRSLRIEADPLLGGFDTGVFLGGACATTVDGLTVSGALGAGLRIARDGGSSRVPVTNARLEANGAGLRLEQGDVHLQSPVVATNASHGIEAVAVGPGQLDGLSVADGLVHRNGGAGLRVASPLRFELVRTRVCGNAGARETLSGNAVRAGGMLVIGNPPAGAVVAGNRFDENGGDQVVFYNGGTWNLSAPSCDAALPNAFAGYDVPGGAVGLFALGARVDAVFAAWPSAPRPNVDYRALGGSAQVNVGASGEDCLLDVVPACP